MATKAQPGEYDCYANLDPNEPYFVLRAHDAQAPALVRQWAYARREMIAMGRKPREDEAVVEEALDCAAQMEKWRIEQGSLT